MCARTQLRSTSLVRWRSPSPSPKYSDRSPAPHHLVGYRAEVILGLGVAPSETKAGEVSRLDVRDAVAGAADRRGVAARWVVAHR